MIGILTFVGAGAKTAADYVASHHGFVRVASWSDTLVDFAAAVGASGIVADEAEPDAARGFVVLVRESGARPQGRHDARVLNDGPLEILHLRLDGLMDRFIAQAA